MTNILKYKNKIIAVALAFVMVFSVLVFVSPTEAQAVSINATDTGFYNLAYGATGATSFNPGAQIRVINDTRSGKNKNDAVYEFDGATWSAVDPNKYIVWDGSSDNTFYGVYPYNAEYDKFTIPTDQSGGVQDADWMTDDYIGTKGSGNGVDFKFQHRLAKVTVEIADWNSEFDNQTHEITYPIIYSKGKDLTANYNDDGSVTITSTGNDREITPLVSEDKASYTAIVAPVKYNTSDTFMTFTVNGQEMTVKANGNTTLTEGLKAGYHYTFDLTVGKEAVTLTSVTVNGWAEKDIDGGVAEGTNVFTYDASEITNIDGLNAMTTALKAALNAGRTEIIINYGEKYDLGYDQPTFNGEIAKAINASGAADGSLNLTLQGVNAGRVVRSLSGITKLKTVTLPDATILAAYLFQDCTNLTAVYAPKATSFRIGVFDGCTALTTIELSAAGEFSYDGFDGDDLTNAFDGLIYGNVDLVLNADKESAVTGDNTWQGLTFKSITFANETA